MKLFGIDIAKEVAKAIPSGSQGVPPITLRKWAPGTRNPAQLSAGTHPTSLDYVTRGIVTQWELHEIEDIDMVERTDKKVLLIADPLNTAGVRPAVQDLIILDDGTTLTIVWAPDRDPASATYTVACRG